MWLLNLASLVAWIIAVGLSTQSKTLFAACHNEVIEDVTTVYVSPSGDDADGGTWLMPLQTLPAAKACVRSLQGNLGPSLVTGNDVSHFTEVYMDGGGIYIDNAQMGSQVSGNYIHDFWSTVVQQSEFTSGLYFDEGSSDVSGENLVTNGSYALQLQDCIGRSDCHPARNINMRLHSAGVTHLQRGVPSTPVNVTHMSGFDAEIAQAAGVSEEVRARWAADIAAEAQFTNR